MVDIHRPPDRYARVDGVRLRYLTLGAGDPVLLLHGLGGVAEEWLLLLPRLVGARRVLALDLPGFGLSDKPSAPYTPAYFARVVRGFLRQQGIGRVALVGHSLGGGVCLEIADRYPEVCERLVLLAPGGLSRHVGMGIRLLATPGLGEILIRRRRRGPDAERREPSATPVDLLRILRARRRRAKASPRWRRAVLATVRASVTPLGLRATLAARAHRRAHTIETPTLFIWGDRDQVVPLHSSVWARDALPNATLNVLRGIGHHIHLACPDETARLILEFLDRA